MKLLTKAFFAFFLLLNVNLEATAQEYYDYYYDDYYYYDYSDSYSDDYNYDYDYTYDDSAYYEYIEGWEIKSFDVEISLNRDSSFEVTEKIVADFSNEAHRGILKSIPYDYENGKTVRINYESALDAEGNPWLVDLYKEYGYLNIAMKTQDDSESNGIETFLLKYTVENAINYFPDENQDEFYWNVNGPDWPIKINSVSATIHLPEELEVELKCYTGKYGEEGYDCKWKEDGKAINFLTTRNFEPYENLTVVIGLPHGILEKPSIVKRAWWILVDNKGILLAPLTFLLMFTLWYKHGRDDQTVKDTIMPHYEPPPNLLPSEIGTIIDEDVNPRDITATIIDHAIKGHIKITETQEKKFIGKTTDYELEVIKPWVGVKIYEDKMLSAIFGENKIGAKKKISELQDKFYVYMKPIQKALIEQLIKDGYFPSDPMSVRSIYMSIGGLILIFSINFAGLLIGILSLATTIGIILSGIVILIFGFFMPRKTKKGTEVYYQLKGLHEYINTAEKDRMKFQAENNIMFEKLLPYAMAFGLVQKWSQAFDGILKTPPTWFVPYGSWSNGFSMNTFAGSLNNFSYKATSNLSSRPGGKGGGGWSGRSGFSGGFSGGGFGGGGGRGL